jgi:hypothetical protein
LAQKLGMVKMGRVALPGATFTNGFWNDNISSLAVYRDYPWYNTCDTYLG